MKKILSISIIVSFIICSWSASGLHNETKILSDEILDQSTPFGYDGFACGAWNTYIAQSFKPKLPILSKVEIGLFKQENAEGTVTVSIRQRLGGEDLVSKTIPVESIPLGSEADWVEFDFDDIEVIPNIKYYIVFTMNDGERPENVVLWVHTLWNPYWRGRPWQYTIQGIWLPTCIMMIKLPDACFRTYGYQ